MSASQRATRLLAGVAACLPAAGCQYEIDKLFEHAEQEQKEDGGADAGEAPLPAELIDLWAEGSVSDECVACAKEKCGDVNAACRDDAECAALTRCVGEAQSPADQYDCRAEHIDWLVESVQERDIGGPYQQCVFLNRCGNECDSHTQLSCTRQFDWPMTNDSIVMHLRFVEGLNNSAPLVGLSVRACRAEDPLQCQPVDSPEFVTNEDGIVHLEVPPSLGSFQGYLELSGAGIYPTLLRFGWPIAKELVTNVAVVNEENVNRLIWFSAVEVDADRGLLQLRAFGCNGITARDISFEVAGADDRSKTWYTAAQDLAPIFDATSTADRGAGGIINVPGGRRRVTASHEGELIASLTAPVRPGHMTIIVVPPGDQSL
jgi:hypothetical protein